MGEAKRRAAHDTLDGGPPSDDPIVMVLYVFQPLMAMMEGDDRVRLEAVAGAYKRAHQRPSPLCSACDYQFAFGEPVPLLWCAKPEFPKAEEYTFMSGSICLECAALPPDELMAAIVGYLRVVKPDLAIVETGTA